MFSVRILFLDCRHKIQVLTTQLDIEAEQDHDNGLHPVQSTALHHSLPHPLSRNLLEVWVLSIKHCKVRRNRFSDTARSVTSSQEKRKTESWS